MAYEYRLSGKWNDPKVEKLGSAVLNSVRMPQLRRPRIIHPSNWRIHKMSTCARSANASKKTRSGAATAFACNRHPDGVWPECRGQSVRGGNAAGNGCARAKLAVLPSILPSWACGTDKVEVREADGKGPIQRFLAEQAKLHDMWIVGGLRRWHVIHRTRCSIAAWYTTTKASVLPVTTKIHCSVCKRAWSSIRRTHHPAGQRGCGCWIHRLAV